MTTSFGIRLAAACIFATGLAIVFRLPSCSESFWLDELHSAWAVADGLGAVAPRAAIGNQTPLYFQALWLWQALVGDGELALRMSSVLLCSVAAGCLVVGVAMQTKHVAGGVVAGGILAMDPNAVFFGCELRPYAAVMLGSVLAAWSAIKWIAATNDSLPRWRCLCIAAVCVTTLLHPTALGVLGWLIAIVSVLRWRARGGRGRGFSRWDAVAVCVVAVTATMLWRSSLLESWDRRDQWRAFAKAEAWAQLWDERRAWSWIPIVIIPSGIALTWEILRRWRVNAANRSWSGWVPGIAGVIGTVVFFVASYGDIVPLWHRRYFVAALPLLAWTAGVASVWVLPITQRGSVLASLSSAMVLGFLTWHQGTFSILKSGRVPLQLRYEPWREAVAMVRDQRQSGDVIWLDTGLIEASFFSRPRTETADLSTADWAYLAFPVSGPYSLEHVKVVSTTEHDSWLRLHLEQIQAETERIWLISRQHPSVVNRYCESLRARAGFDSRIRRMGQLRVVEFTPRK